MPCEQIALMYLCDCNFVQVRDCVPMTSRETKEKLFVQSIISDQSNLKVFSEHDSGSFKIEKKKLYFVQTARVQCILPHLIKTMMKTNDQLFKASLLKAVIINFQESDSHQDLAEYLKSDLNNTQRLDEIIKSLGDTEIGVITID